MINPSLLGKCRKYKIGIGEIKMNNEQRKKLKILKYANEENIKKIQWKNNILLQECLNNLETYQIISDDTTFHFQSWASGRLCLGCVVYG